MAATELMKALAAAEVGYELIPHGRTETASAEAESLGVAPHEVAKTLVVATPGGYARAVVPASERLDLRKLRALLGDGRKEDVRLATEEELVRDYPEFELGAVPPLGGARSDPVFLDHRLAERDSVVFEAGSHEESVRMRTADLLALAGARIGDLCRD